MQCRLDTFDNKITKIFFTNLVKIHNIENQHGIFWSLWDSVIAVLFSNLFWRLKCPDSHERTRILTLIDSIEKRDRIMSKHLSCLLDSRINWLRPYRFLNYVIKSLLFLKREFNLTNQLRLWYNICLGKILSKIISSLRNKISCSVLQPGNLYVSYYFV